MYPKDLKAEPRRDICTHVFTGALLAIVRSRSHPSAHRSRWINQMWRVRTVGWHPASKRREILTRTLAWMNSEDVLFSEGSQSQKDKYWMVPFV